MILNGVGTTLHIQCRETVPPGQIGAGDVRLSVQLSAPGFTGVNEKVWVSREACRTFLTDLGAMETRRAGEALLGSANPGDLNLRVHVYDHAGHVRVVGHVGDYVVWADGGQSARIPFRIEIDPGMLASLLESFTSLLMRNAASNDEQTA
jgi:hypothetical protein